MVQASNSLHVFSVLFPGSSEGCECWVSEIISDSENIRMRLERLHSFSQAHTIDLAINHSVLSLYRFSVSFVNTSHNACALDCRQGHSHHRHARTDSEKGTHKEHMNNRCLRWIRERRVWVLFGFHNPTWQADKPILSFFFYIKIFSALKDKHRYALLFKWPAGKPCRLMWGSNLKPLPQLLVLHIWSK